MFLEGRSNALTDELTRNMEQAAEQLEFEKAAAARDLIALLRRVQDQQSMESGHGNVDIIAATVTPGGASVHVISVRDGRVLGSNNFFPQVAIEEESADVLAAFTAQYYLGQKDRDFPSELIVSSDHPDWPAIAEAIAQQSGHILGIRHRVRGTRARWQKMAITNAEQALQARLANRMQMSARFSALAKALDLSEPPAHLECFDISHSSGEATVASCVVFGPEGPRKSDYRLYNIEGVTAGDDYAAMRQVLTRRYRRLVSGEGKRPDLVFIDGGKGQLNIAREVFEELGISDIPLIGVAKGVTRRAGMEQLIDAMTGDVFRVPADSPALHLIQHIRDESH